MKKNLLEKARIFARFWQSGAVLFLDKKLKRNPTIASRMKYLRAQQAGLELLMENPSMQKKLPPGSSDQMKSMGPVLDMMEKAIRGGSTMTMQEMEEMTKNPQLMQQQVQPKMRTRPGPPMKGRRRY